MCSYATTEALNEWNGLDWSGMDGIGLDWIGLVGMDGCVCVLCSAPSILFIVPLLKFQGHNDVLIKWNKMEKGVHCMRTHSVRPSVSWSDSHCVRQLVSPSVRHSEIEMLFLFWSVSGFTLIVFLHTYVYFSLCVRHKTFAYFKFINFNTLHDNFLLKFAHLYPGPRPEGTYCINYLWP